MQITAIYRCRHCGDMVYGRPFNIPCSMDTGVEIVISLVAKFMVENMEDGPNIDAVLSRIILHECTSHIGVCELVGFGNRRE